MLLRVEFRNHRSFRDEASLSLVSSNLKEDVTGTFLHSGIGILPLCVIYGANASGKSNVIDVLKYIKHVVKNSHARWEPDEGVTHFPFKLEKDYIIGESRYSIDFVVDGVLYQFGFELNKKSFVSEWLYAYPKKLKQVWYERRGQEFKFGKSLKGNVSTIQSITRGNSLFLSAGAQNNNAQLLPIHAFLSSIQFSGDLFVPGNSLHMGLGSVKKILQFLKFADTGIVDAKVEVSEAPDDVKEVLLTIKEAIETKNRRKPGQKGRTEFLLSGPGFESVETVSFGHQGEGGDTVYLDLHEESSGTIRLANLLAPILRVLEDGGVLVVDELDASLHTLLALKIIEMFNSTELNTKGAQLIAATHDTNMLCSPILRRDQIWFVEKDKSGASSLYPLTDFSVRRADNLEKGYLEGRFGAVPFLGSIRAIREKLSNGEM